MDLRRKLQMKRERYLILQILRKTLNNHKKQTLQNVRLIKSLRNRFPKIVQVKHFIQICSRKLDQICALKLTLILEIKKELKISDNRLKDQNNLVTSSSNLESVTLVLQSIKSMTGIKTKIRISYLCNGMVNLWFKFVVPLLVHMAWQE